MKKQQQQSLWTPDELSRLRESLPSDTFAESVVLGACLERPDTHLPVARSILSSDDFYLEAHRAIWSAIVALDESGRRPDRVTVASWLRDQGRLESVGGITKIAALDSSVPALVSIEGYCRILHDKGMLRRLIRHAAELQAMCFQAEADPMNLVAEMERRAMEVCQDVATSKGEADTFEEVVEAKGGLDKYFSRDLGRAARTPWPELNDILGPMMPGQLVCFAARPACGKTVVGLQLAAHTARSRETVFCSLEMQPQELYDRLVAARGGIRHETIQAGIASMSSEEKRAVMAAASDIATLKLRINPRAARTVSSLRGYLMRLRASRRPAEVVVVDYLQLMRGPMGGGNKRYDEVSDITRNLKLLAEEMNVVMVILSQLNREVERRPGGRPQLSDLRESGTIEQDSDKVVFLHRPELYKRDDPSLVGQMVMIVNKNRQGRIGDVILRFEPEFQRVVRYTPMGIACRQDTDATQTRSAKDSQNCDVQDLWEEEAPDTVLPS